MIWDYVRDKLHKYKKNVKDEEQPLYAYLLSICATFSALQVPQQRLLESKSMYRDRQQLVQRVNEDSNEIVQFDVGGAPLTLTAQSLDGRKTFFGSLFELGPREDDGKLFVDRDPTASLPLLNDIYRRDDQFTPPKQWTNCAVDQATAREANFLCEDVTFARVICSPLDRIGVYNFGGGIWQREPLPLHALASDHRGAVFAVHLAETQCKLFEYVLQPTAAWQEKSLEIEDTAFVTSISTGDTIACMAVSNTNIMLGIMVGGTWHDFIIDRKTLKMRGIGNNADLERIDHFDIEAGRLRCIWCVRGAFFTLHKNGKDLYMFLTAENTWRKFGLQTELQHPVELLGGNKQYIYATNGTSFLCLDTLASDKERVWRELLKKGWPPATFKYERSVVDGADRLWLVMTNRSMLFWEPGTGTTEWKQVKPVPVPNPRQLVVPEFVAATHLSHSTNAQEENVLYFLELVAKEMWEWYPGWCVLHTYHVDRALWQQSPVNARSDPLSEYMNFDIHASLSHTLQDS